MRNQHAVERDAERACDRLDRFILTLFTIIAATLGCLFILGCLLVNRADAGTKPMPKFEQPACIPITTMLGTLLGQAHEKPLFAFRVGQSDGVMFVVNQDTGTVTQLVQCLTKDGVEGARIILFGDKFHAVSIEDFLGPQL